MKTEIKYSVIIKFVIWGGFSVLNAPYNSHIISQILLIANKSSIFEVGYIFNINSNLIINIKNVKKPITRGSLAVVKFYSLLKGVNDLVENKWQLVHKFEATQRLHAGDLVFAYLVGLIEGDGWFSVYKINNFLKYEFGIEIHIRDIQLLYKLKNLLGVGTIHIRTNNERKTALYRIRNKSHLKLIILPIFDKYPMFSNKYFDYLRFKKLLLNESIYYNENDVSTYIRPNESFHSIETILNKSYFQAWLIGFIEAEGCFCIYTSIKDCSKIASFDISQTNGLNLIKAIKIYLSLTSKIYKDKNNNFKLKVSSIRQIENVIKFIQKNSLKLLGYKKLQYLLWLKELRQIPRYSNKINIPNKY
jgi:ubiquinol-cytochrome c reductase cytochrome b subunit